MNWQDALEIAILKTGHEHYRTLTADDSSYRDGYRAIVMSIATGNPLPEMKPIEIPAPSVVQPTKGGCCGGAGMIFDAFTDEPESNPSSGQVDPPL